MTEPEQPGQPSEEELKALEDQVRNLRVEDLILQSAVSLLNLSARRIGKEDERDLEQARLGIEAAHGLAELVPEQARPQVRQAVSELQLLYAKTASGDEGGGEEEGGGESTGSQGPKTEGGGGESKLWTPGG